MWHEAAMRSPYSRSIIALGVLICIAQTGCAKTGETPQPPAATASPAPAPCDRACLEDFIDQYLKAAVAHDPSRLPISDDVTFIENNQPLKLGEGTWKTLTGLGEYRHVFADPENGRTVAITVVQENGTDALFDLYLAVRDRKIATVESMMIRDSHGPALYAKLRKPEDVWLSTVPPEQRATREELMATADKYYTGMSNNDGKGDYSFFADDCDRLEHGLKTTNNKPSNYGHSHDQEFVTMGCAQQFRYGFLGFVTRIRDRRYVVVDVERQAVFASAFLDHNGTVRNVPLSNGKMFRVPQYFSIPRTLEGGEAFKIHDKKIQRIEMTLNEYPYGMKPPFPTKDPAPTSAPVAAKTKLDAKCDRACLEQAVDQVLGAFTAHDPARAPLAPDVRYTENDQALAIGDGLWGTATTFGPYRVTFADADRGEAVFIGRSKELDVPGVLAMRLKVSDGFVTEIEVVLPREELNHAETLFRPHLTHELKPNLFTQVDPAYTRLVPPAARASRDVLLALAKQYLDGIERGSSAGVPFTGQCSVRENGAPLSGCQASIEYGEFHRDVAFRDRRDWIVDAERGVVVVLAYRDVPGGNNPVPYTLLAPVVFSIENGQIHRVELIEKTAPYGLKPGWPAQPS
jgi:hypothetical protein